MDTKLMCDILKGKLTKNNSMNLKKLLGIFIIGITACTGRGTQKQDVIKGQDSIMSLQDELQQINKELNCAEVIVYTDTTMFRYFDIDGDGLVDTLTTRVFVRADTVFIYYSWLQEQKIIWSDLDKDPYLTALEPAEKKEWLDFIIEGCCPKSEKISDYENLVDYAIDFGIDDLKKKGFNINKEQYKTYIINYEGNLINYGHPEMREKLFIWYEPLKNFVLFYNP